MILAVLLYRFGTSDVTGYKYVCERHAKSSTNHSTSRISRGFMLHSESQHSISSAFIRSILHLEPGESEMELVKILTHPRTMPVCYSREGYTEWGVCAFPGAFQWNMALYLNSDRSFTFSYLLCFNKKCNNASEPDHKFINSEYQKLQRPLILVQDCQINDRPVHATTTRCPEGLSKVKKQ
jgi:hypothetical protein